MNPNQALANQLRQAVQGCTVHIHGPIQAWAAIEQASRDGSAEVSEVAKLAIDACSSRILELKKVGVGDQDIRIRKEELTRAFIEKLLLK